MWFAFTILGSVIVLSRAVPKCPELGEYTMQQDVKDHIVPKVLLHSPGKDITDVFSVYDCYLEKMAGEILKDPHKPIKFLESIGIYPLVYSIDGKGETNVRLMSHAALDDWKKYIETIPFYTFGCNYRKEDGHHKYLCLLRHEA